MDILSKEQNKSKVMVVKNDRTCMPKVHESQWTAALQGAGMWWEGGGPWG